MTKKIDYQAVWNECLIKSWKAGAPMHHFVKQFLLIVNPNYIYGDELQDYYEFITNLNLKKCLDWRSSKLEFGATYIMPVKDYIYIHSPQLSACLWAGTVPTDEIIKHLANFKWKRIGKSPAVRMNKNAKRNNKMDRARTRRVYARDLDKNYDWDTVK